jgi:hypothetical protein
MKETYILFQPFQILRGDRDPAAEAGVEAEILQLLGVLRVGV